MQLTQVHNNKIILYREQIDIIHIKESDNIMDAHRQNGWFKLSSDKMVTETVESYQPRTTQNSQRIKNETQSTKHTLLIGGVHCLMKTRNCI